MFNEKETTNIIVKAHNRFLHEWPLKGMLL